MISIGKGPRGGGAEGIVPRLLDCHERIRRFTAHAVRLGDEAAAPADQVRDAAVQVLSYFQKSLPHHSADEEESIAPHLGDVPALRDMVEQHRDIDATLEALIPMWQELVGDPERRDVLRHRLSLGAARLQRLFDAHLELEETTIFPLIDELPADLQAQIVDEMIKRRLP